MALERNEIVKLMKAVVNAEPSAPSAYEYNGISLSYDDMNETLRKEMNELAGTYSLYRENKNLIFSIIEEVINDVLPKKAEEIYSAFAEVKQFKQGDKPMFKRKISGSRTRAKQFITRVGLAGMYEVFKLGGEESFEVKTSAIGGAAQIGFEEFLDGRADFAEVTAIVMEGMNELIYREVEASLVASLGQLPTANVVSTNGFDEASFDRLVMIAEAYGTPTIYCFKEFAVKLIPGESWRYTDAMKDMLWKQGWLGDYKGTKVIILPQAFEDETNAKKTMNPSYCWIIPSGSDKPVKIAFEGDTIVDEFKNYDRSREIQVYKKVGVTTMFTNAICSYQDLSLNSLTTWNFSGNVSNGVSVSGGLEISGEITNHPVEEESGS